MKKFTICLLLFVFVTLSANAQITQIDSNGITLQKLAVLIQGDSNATDRFAADSIFTRALVQTLKTPNSFEFKFDSLRSVKHIVSPDNKFKFFTWQIDLGDGTYRQRGAIQLKTNNGALKLIPLFDNSDFNPNPTIGILDKKQWIGAIYFEIIPIQLLNTTYYALIGYDEYKQNVSRKIIEIMHFENDQPLFGGDYFSYVASPVFPTAPVDRFILQYKKGSNANVRYDKETNSIIISALTSTDNDLNNPSTLVPTGNELSFEWKNGKWTMPKKN
jgi:hypothetical protein